MGTLQMDIKRTICESHIVLSMWGMHPQHFSAVGSGKIGTPSALSTMTWVKNEVNKTQLHLQSFIKTY